MQKSQESQKLQNIQGQNQDGCDDQKGMAEELSCMAQETENILRNPRIASSVSAGFCRC